MTTDDWKSIGKGALVAAAGAVLAYATSVIPGMNLGVYGPIVAAALAVVANIFRKWAGIP